MMPVNDVVHDGSEKNESHLAQSRPSQAMMMYEGYPLKNIPTSIHWLGPNLNLSVPPENWLRGSSSLEKYILEALYRRHRKSYMSSISMAHSNVDVLDSIDVISDAKNIKDMLKIPFAKGEPLSLMIHRVGKTLLIDDFDVHKHLFRKQKDDWKWLKKFYTEMVRNGKTDTEPSRVQQTHKKLLDRNIFSKFLYYSIMERGECEEVPTADSRGEVVFTPPQYEPRAAEPDPESLEIGEELYPKVHDWQFEDLRMMIGSNLPIFTDGSSCVSLRLRETDDPITVLTGLDYWLDNLMCNVPEIAMCYHLGGFVQRYERLSTSDIPNIEGSEFKPEFVSDVAQNILSFLRSNATQVGHTYWLYKAKDDDIVKLYDLTSLTDSEEINENPFSHPLASLLFKVALKLHKKKNPEKSGVIRALLNACLTLATEAALKIAATAHLILSEVYLMDDDADVTANIFASNDTETVDDESEFDSNEGAAGEGSDSLCRQLDVTSLSDTQPSAAVTDSSSQFPSITGSRETRCLPALNHIAKGLSLIDKDIDEMEAKAEKMQDLPKTSAPSIAIPLPYRPLTSPTTEELPPSESNDSTVGHIRHRLRVFANTWHRQSKASLLSKAMFSFCTLTSSAELLKEYGKALKYCKLAFLCYDVLSQLDTDAAADRQDLYTDVIKVCGDVQYHLMSRESKIDVYTASYQSYTEQEKCILESTLKDIPVQSFTHLYTMHKSVEQRALIALQCYEQVKELRPDGDNRLQIMKRLGNVCNDIANLYMDKVVHLYTNVHDIPEEQVSTLKQDVDKFIDAAEKNIEKALSSFRSISDRNNMAMILCNLAKLYRVKTLTIDTSADENYFGPEIRQLYKQATEKYMEALAVLEKRETSPQMWENVNHELSGVYFTTASLLQDYNPGGDTTSREEVGREVNSRMLEALKYCQPPTSAGNYGRIQYRKATIYHRLASLNHHAYRQGTEGNDATRKLRQFSTRSISNYDKSIAAYLSINSFTGLFRVIIEKAAYYDFGFDNVSSNQSLLTQGVNVLLDEKTAKCLQAFSYSTDTAEGEEEEIKKLLALYTQKIQQLLKSLVKESLPSGTLASSNRRRTQKERDMLSTIHTKYREMYRTSLLVNIKELPLLQLAANVLDMYKSVKEMFLSL